MKLGGRFLNLCLKKNETSATPLCQPGRVGAASGSDQPTVYFVTWVGAGRHSWRHSWLSKDGRNSEGDARRMGPTAYPLWMVGEEAGS